MSSFRYLVKQGISNVWINRLMSFASVAILTACFILVGGAMLLGLNVRDLFVAIESQNEMVVYLEDSITEKGAQQLQQHVSELDGVASVRYVSKADALQEQREWLGEDAALLDGLDNDNPLPASLRVTLTDLSKLSDVEAECRSFGGVESVSSPTYLAETLTGIQRILLTLGIAIIAILLLASLVVISNTIRLTVYSRRREINIMKYVGATNAFIRLPFVVEGIVIGLIAAVLSFGALTAAYFMIGKLLNGSIIPWVATITSGLIPYSKLWYWFAGGFLIAGFVIGAFGTGRPVRKYLKV